MFDDPFKCKSCETVPGLQFFTKIINGRFGQSWIVDIKALENGIKLDVLFHEEVVNVVPDDVVVEIAVPKGIRLTLSSSAQFGCDGRLERSDNRRQRS